MKLNEMKEKSVADLEIEYEGGSFYCTDSELTSLKGSPSKVDGNFDCYINNLTSLVGAPLEVGGSFDCESNELISLEGAPQKVGRHFWCYDNRLTSLEGAPLEVGGAFNCEINQLTSLEGAPPVVGGNFNCSRNNLTSLKNIHRQIKKIDRSFRATKCPIKSHVLGLLLIKNLKGVELDNKEVAAIINAHLDGGSMKSALDCQHALIKAGFPEYAKL